MEHPILERNMSTNLKHVRPEQSVKMAAQIMEECNVRHLPVYGKNGSLVGILSDRDIKRAMDPRSSAIAKDLCVADYMSWPVLTVSQYEQVETVLRTMIERKISAVVVTQEKGSAGIVTSEDMLRLLLDMLKEAPKKLTFKDYSYVPYVQEFLHEANAAGI